MSTQSLRDKLKQAEAEVNSLQSQIHRAEAQCKHQWGPVEYIPVEHPGYTDPGDPVGTMGIDWRGPTYVSSSTEKKWSRTCSLCLRTETTKTTRKKDTYGSVPGTTAVMEVPYFPEIGS